jgi:hypothetical protein
MIGNRIEGCYAGAGTKTNAFELSIQKEITLQEMAKAMQEEAKAKQEEAKAKQEITKLKIKCIELLMKDGVGIDPDVKDAVLAILRRRD